LITSKEEKPKLKTAPIKEFFRYVDGKDKCMLFIGTTMAVLSGAVFPLMAIVFGELLEAFD
jgi:hypothetical protein